MKFDDLSLDEKKQKIRNFTEELAHFAYEELQRKANFLARIIYFGDKKP